MVISISASLLSNYYNAKYGIGASATNTASTKAATPTPPWQSTSTAPKQAALVSAVMGGAKFIDPSATQLTAPGGTEASDYKNLFALYQGVTALQGLATNASASGVSSAQVAQYSLAFSAGMTQLQTFLNQTSWTGMEVTQGTFTASDQTKEGAPQETDDYTTGTIYSGSANDPVPALSGAVQFSMTATDTSGATKQVNFDLSEMGDTPRTIGNVVNYLNAQLYTMGMTTRFKDVATPVAAQTTTVAGATVTLAPATTAFALQIVGTPTEALTFSAPTTAPAVYVTSASGTAAAAATSTTAAVTGDQTQEVTKLDTAAVTPSTAVTSNTVLQSAVSSALASATAPDGSLYVLANVDGTTADGQTITGTQDVALMKYDSAGNLLYTRTLGAANSATGYALAVSSDGSKVAIAGSVTGALDATDPGESATSTNSFVTEYDAAGDEQWTNTQASTAGDSATGVAFGSDNSVYVTGTTQSALPGGGGEIGKQDGYVRGYTPSGATTFTQQFGTAGTDTPAGIAVSGSSIYVAGAENGDAVVRQFNLGASGTATAGAVRDLGSLQGGDVVGVGVNSDGSVVVAGSTHNGALSAGTVTSAYQSGQEGFVASLGADLQPAATDKLTYVKTAGDLTANAMTVSGGQVYLAGTVATTAPANSGFTNTTAGYAAAIDPTTGAVTWSQSLQGTDDKDAPTSIAVAATGSSVLDALGLPTAINYAQSALLVSNTSVRAGDTFSVQSGSGVSQKVTIEATDTLQTLATKIERASNYTVTATTLTVNGSTQLKLVPANNSIPVKLIAGPAGGDALAGLGLNAGVLSNDVNLTSTASKTAKVTLGLNLSASLNLNSSSAMQTALTALNLASAKIQNAYQSLITPYSSTTSTSSSSTPSKYVQAQISNYQSALSWLQANEDTTSTSTLLL